MFIVRIGNLKGGFDFNTGGGRIVDVSKSAKKSTASEIVQQSNFFDAIRRTEPRPPTVQRRKKSGPNKGQLFAEEIHDDPVYLNHPLYPLTRVRHFPNEGKRNPQLAFNMGIREGAFDIALDCSRFVDLNFSISKPRTAAADEKLFHGFRLEFKTLDGKPSPAQIIERAWLERENYFAHYAYHSIEGLALLAFYLGFSPNVFVGFPRSRTALRDFDPENLGHDARCGCTIKIRDITGF